MLLSLLVNRETARETAYFNMLKRSIGLTRECWSLRRQQVLCVLTLLLPGKNALPSLPSTYPKSGSSREELETFLDKKFEVARVHNFYFFSVSPFTKKKKSNHNKQYLGELFWRQWIQPVCALTLRHLRWYNHIKLLGEIWLLRLSYFPFHGATSMEPSPKIMVNWLGLSLPDVRPTVIWIVGLSFKHCDLEQLI